jgi:hypothetical protein
VLSRIVVGLTLRRLPRVGGLDEAAIADEKDVDQRALVGGVNTGTMPDRPCARCGPLAALIAPVLLAGCSSSQSGAAQTCSETCSGTCTTLASGLATPVDLAVDSHNVYWTASDGTVNAIPIDGTDGGTYVQLATGQSTPSAIAVDATNVYFTTDPLGASALFPIWETSPCSVGLSRVPIASGAPAIIVSNLLSCGTFAVDSSGIYWTADLGLCPTDMDADVDAIQREEGGALGFKEQTADATIEEPIPLCAPNPEDGGLACGGPTLASAGFSSLGNDAAVPLLDAAGLFPLCTGNVMRLPPGSEAPSLLTEVGAGWFWLSSPITTDSQNVYWATDNVIMKVSKSGGPPIVLASGLCNPPDIAVDSSNVYWTEQCNLTCADDDSNCAVGTVMSVPIDGGPMTTIASGQAGPLWIAVDETSVYWTTTGCAYGSPDGTVMKAPRTGGGTPVTLASGEEGPTALAVDETSVYWIDQGLAANTGMLRKLTPK